jgi:hypothetical protein
MSTRRYDVLMATQVQVRLSDEELILLDRLAGDELTRSDVIRQSLAALDRERRRHDIDRAYVEEYRRLPDTPEEMRIAEANLRAFLAEADW